MIIILGMKSIRFQWGIDFEDAVEASTTIGVRANVCDMRYNIFVMSCRNVRIPIKRMILDMTLFGRLESKE